MYWICLHFEKFKIIVLLLNLTKICEVAVLQTAITFYVWFYPICFLK